MHVLLEYLTAQSGSKAKFGCIQATSTQSYFNFKWKTMTLHLKPEPQHKWQILEDSGG